MRVIPGYPQDQDGPPPAAGEELARAEYLALAWAGDPVRVVIQPAGRCAETLLVGSHLRKHVIALCDSDPALQGTTRFGLPVVAPGEIEGLNPDYVLIASPANEEHIARQLEGLRGIPVLRLSRVPLAANPVELWRLDARFQELFGLVAARTVVDEKRCFQLVQWLQQALAVEGDCAEIGVFQGGTSRLLAGLAGGRGRSFHLFDTFAGMPATDREKDIHREGDFLETSLESVRSFLAPCPNVSIHPGWFPETAGPVAASRFAFVHVDVDVYRSVLDCCEFFYPRMNPGGVMVFDDYGFLSCPGARLAVDEFFRERPEHPCYLPTGQCILVKAVPCLG